MSLLLCVQTLDYFPMFMSETYKSFLVNGNETSLTSGKERLPPCKFRRLQWTMHKPGAASVCGQQISSAKNSCERTAEQTWRVGKRTFNACPDHVTRSKRSFDCTAKSDWFVVHTIHWLEWARFYTAICPPFFRNTLIVFSTYGTWLVTETNY